MSSPPPAPLLSAKQAIEPQPSHSAEKIKGSAPLSHQWTKGLKQAIGKMSDEELYSQFIINFFSDRSLLYMQWTHTLFNNVYLRPQVLERLYLWFDDILFHPLEFTMEWDIPEVYLSGQDSFENLLSTYGKISCFHKHNGKPEDYGSRQFLTRNVKSLDGFTLMLLTELLLRHKIKFDSVRRPEYGKVYMSLHIDKQFTYDAELIRETRAQLFKHLLEMSLVFPFMIVNIPNEELKLANGRSITEISLAMMIAILNQIKGYLAYSTIAPTAELWIHELYEAASQLHSRSFSSVRGFNTAISCSCHFCDLATAVFQKFYVVEMNDKRQQGVTSGTLILSYYYNKSLKDSKWFDSEDDAIIQQQFLKEQREKFLAFIQEISHDTITRRLYIQFKSNIAERKPPNKKRRFE
jgi:hypothetical protein